MVDLAECLFDKFKTDKLQSIDYRLNKAIEKTIAFPALNKQLLRVKNDIYKGR